MLYCSLTVLPFQNTDQASWPESNVCGKRQNGNGDMHTMSYLWNIREHLELKRQVHLLLIHSAQKVQFRQLICKILCANLNLLQHGCGYVSVHVYQPLHLQELRQWTTVSYITGMTSQQFKLIDIDRWDITRLITSDWQARHLQADNEGLKG